MSSAVPNDYEKGIPDSGNQANNNNSANGEHDSRNVVNEEEEDIGNFIPPAHPEACAACSVKEDEARLLSEQMFEKEQMNATLIHSLKAKQAELESMKRDHETYTQCRHEINHLRGLVQSIMILGVPVKDHFGPSEIFMDNVRSSTTKIFSSPLANIPPGLWGQARSIEVELPESNQLVPQLVPSSSSDYYIAKEYADYRKSYAEFLDSNQLFQCAACLKPLYKQLKWILCMRCLAVPYCSTTCIQGHKPLHGIGCKTHRVWMADIEPLRPTTATYPPSTSISTSTSSSSSDGKGGKGKGKGKGQHDQSTQRKRPRTGPPDCWHFTNYGMCNKGDSCPKDHDNEARQRHLEKELARLSSSKVVQQTGAYGSYDGDHGADGDADGVQGASTRGGNRSGRVRRSDGLGVCVQAEPIAQPAADGSQGGLEHRAEQPARRDCSRC